LLFDHDLDDLPQPLGPEDGLKKEIAEPTTRVENCLTWLAQPPGHVSKAITKGAGSPYITGYVGGVRAAFFWWQVSNITTMIQPHHDPSHDQPLHLNIPPLEIASSLRKLITADQTGALDGSEWPHHLFFSM
jgi:hypothetical protein